MPSLDGRARVHAALGEPVRLAIVDRLVLGDVSPSALGSAVGLPTNLLAHHLRILESAGIIRRVRSEGDGRRNYVQLVSDDDFVTAITRTAGPGPVAADRVLFVCSRNSARSQIALAAWSARSNVPAASAGTRPADRVHPKAVRVAKRHGLDLSSAVPCRIGEVTRAGDLVVAVCDNAFEELSDEATHLHWAIPDPARVDTDDAFETAYQQIISRVDRLAGAVNARDQEGSA